jgi:acetyltransferase-like isoleucine patch superfamily enzyme
MKEGKNVKIGDYTNIAEDVRLGNDVVIGNRVTIYPNTTIEDGCRIMDGAVIGRLTYRTSAVIRETTPTYQPLSIGARSVIGCNVVLYTGVRLGRETLLADGVSIREDCVLGDQVLLGRYVNLNYNAIIGNRTRIMDLTHITGNAKIGEDCFISMLVGTSNDNDVYLSRFGLHDHNEDFIGPNIGHYVVIAVGVSMNPGVKIGDGALIGAGAVVTKDIAAWMIAMGTPARPIKPIEDAWRKKILSLAARRGQRLSE